MNYVLPIVGAYLVINGIAIASQATTVFQQIGADLQFGFGLLAIGLGALIGVVKTGFGRIEKGLLSTSEKPSTQETKQQPPPPEQQPPPPEKISLLDILAASRWRRRTNPDVAKMNPSEIEEAQRLARYWKPEKNR